MSASENPLTPTYRPDLEAIYWPKDSVFRQNNFFTFPFACPDCGYRGEYVAMIPRKATQREFDDCLAVHRRALSERPAESCPACTKRKRDRGQPPRIPGVTA